MFDCFYPEGVVWVMETIYPEGVTQANDFAMCNPFGVNGLLGRLAQGALADSRPWAELYNAFGV